MGGLYCSASYTIAPQANTTGSFEGGLYCSASYTPATAMRILKMSTSGKLHMPPIKANNEIKKGWQFDLIVMQLSIGFLAALGGVLLFGMTDGYLAHYELFNEVLYAICSAYGGMVIGVAIIGFRYLKQVECQRYLLRFVIQSIVGLAGLPLAVCGLLKLLHLDISNVLVNLIAAFLPLIGAVLGFNLFLLHTLKKKSSDTKPLVVA